MVNPQFGSRAYIKSLTQNAVMPFASSSARRNLGSVGDDLDNREYVLDDRDALAETSIGAGMHICYERHLSR